MAEKNLDPNVIAFKDFINKHPALLKDIRKHGRSWQDHYEKWVLLGEDDPYWDQYKPETDEKQTQTQTKEKSSELFSHLIKLSENIDMEKLQGQVHQLNNTISTVQEVITQFQQSKSKPNTANKSSNWLQD